MHILMPECVAPIGIFDSGLGGLSVVEAIQNRLPGESILYIADSQYAPYGERGDNFIRERSFALTDWLIRSNAKLLVVACNTATAHSIAYLRERFEIPIVGIEPGIKPAVQNSASGIVGVLATAATLRSERLQRLLAEHGRTCRFICQAGHGLVELIERGESTGAVVEALLEKYLGPMTREGVDTLVLGSTHFALLVPSIRRVFGSKFYLIDTAAAVARRVEHLLVEHRLEHCANFGSATVRLCSTASSKESQAPLVGMAAALGIATHGLATIDVESTC